MKILITGATGLIGHKIAHLCEDKKIEVNYLTTSKDKIENKPFYKGFYWDPKNKEIDLSAFDGVEAIINLVGASVSKRWTNSQKEAIIKSRTETAALLQESLKNKEHMVRHIISASAIGIYPSSLEKLYFEEDPAVANTFLGEVVVQWENAIDQFKELGLEVSKVRIGLVLAKNGGILEKIKQPVNYNVGAPLATGKQWQSWIHIDDLASIFLHILEEELTGIYNGVAPNPVTNEEMTKELANLMNKPLWLPNVPKFALRLALGEMYKMVVSSQLVSSKKIESTGFKFQYVHISKALSNLLA